MVSDPPAPPAAHTPLTAVALDDRVEIEDVAARTGLKQVRRQPYVVVLATEAGTLVHVFDFGAVATHGDESAAAPLLEPLVSALGRRMLRETMETWYIGEDPTSAAAAPRVGWDQVVVSERTPERIAAIALLIGQSAALERYERGVDRLLEDVGRTASDLARRGRPPQRSREMVRRIGRINAHRLELARWFFLLGRPEEAWERPEVAELHDALFRNLELEERHRAVLHKLDAAGRGLETAVDIWHARWNHWLEWAIVLLIVVDIVLALKHW